MESGYRHGWGGEKPDLRLSLVSKSMPEREVVAGTGASCSSGLVLFSRSSRLRGGQSSGLGLRAGERGRGAGDLAGSGGVRERSPSLVERDDGRIREGDGDRSPARRGWEGDARRDGGHAGMLGEVGYAEMGRPVGRSEDWGGTLGGQL